MKIVLWGNRAVEFDAESVRVMGAKEPVIAIFVGTLPKMSRGKCHHCPSFKKIFDLYDACFIPMLLHTVTISILSFQLNCFIIFICGL